jgi:hypothetical protein
VVSGEWQEARGGPYVVSGCRNPLCV